ncbi:MAG: 1-deoxy-D-xylulose-5-phosphate reductoisomerase [Amylibacter sp.]|nr:1-deoxy-D-xylulose-5-phosphate reductoisomerase [Amylibacter sp.]
MRTISIFGITGSIGQTAANILVEQSNKFILTVITGGDNVAELAKQAIRLSPKYVVIANEAHLYELRSLLMGYNFEISAGRQALMDAASIPVDVSLQAIVGFPGVQCSLIAAKFSKTLALANKESLVCAGPLLQKICTTNNTKLVPVDSEHSAIFQCMLGESILSVERIILTGSGGPFFNTAIENLKHVNSKQAASHPRWSMGQRISIDSASMFNKAMELIETKELFDVSIDKLEVIIQPQSIIHSMVGFNDGSIKAQLGPADMSGAIGYAINFPKRESLLVERLNFAKLRQLDFLPVDQLKFPAINLATRAMNIGGMAGAVFNAAKEQALDLFLIDNIGFLDMAICVEFALNEYELNQIKHNYIFEDIMEQDTHTRVRVKEMAKGL